MSRRRQRGVTLIELVITITVIAIASVAVLGTISATTVRSADRMQRQQALAVAQAYMEEIALRSFSDPDGTAVREPLRADYDDVDDYNGLADNGARDQLGRSVASLGSYVVRVSVASSRALGGVPQNAVKRIDVTVTDPSGNAVALTGYRSRY
jgi:MSHA pilin protein MshD